VCPDFFCTGGSEERSRGLTPPYPYYTPEAPQRDYIVHLRLNDPLVQPPAVHPSKDYPRPYNFECEFVFAFGIARCLDTNIDESLLGLLFVVG